MFGPVANAAAKAEISANWKKVALCVLLPAFIVFFLAFSSVGSTLTVVSAVRPYLKPLSQGEMTTQAMMFALIASAFVTFFVLGIWARWVKEKHKKDLDT